MSRTWIPAAVRRLYRRALRRLLARRAPPLRIPVDAGMLCAPIERADGSRVTDLRSLERWRMATFGRDDGIDRDEQVLLHELYAEDHHRSYGNPWLAGRFRVDFVLSHGLLPTHRVLDVGCGAGRLGVWLIRHLEEGRYFGIDPHLRSLVAFSAYELRLHRLEDRRPRLLHDDGFRFDRFGVPFDVALDVAVSRHLPEERAAEMYRRLRGVLAAGGRVLAQGLDPHQVEVIRREGYALDLETDAPDPLPTVRPGRDACDRWHVFRATSAGG